MRIAVRVLFLAYLGCAIVMVSTFLPSDKYIFFSLLPLVMPICFFFLVSCVAILLLLRQWKLVAVPALLLIVNIGNWTTLFNVSKETLTSEPSFDVVSYNVSFFGIPQVFSKQYFDSASALKGKAIIEYLTTQEPAVICLQEFFTDAESGHHNYIHGFLEAGYKANLMAITNPKNKTLRGLVTLTRLPILKQGTIFISDSRYNGASYTDILFGRDTVRIVNVHLESNELYFGNKTYSKKLQHFWQHFKKAMITRTEQVRELKKFISNSPHAIVLAGDFNETPLSYNHRMIRKTLHNSFEESGFGWGSTFVKSRLPIRIDHQYHSDGMVSGDFLVDKNIHLSDHYPISARYAWK